MALAAFAAQVLMAEAYGALAIPEAAVWLQLTPLAQYVLAGVLLGERVTAAGALGDRGRRRRRRVRHRARPPPREPPRPPGAPRRRDAAGPGRTPRGPASRGRASGLEWADPRHGE